MVVPLKTNLDIPKCRKDPLVCAEAHSNAPASRQEEGPFGLAVFQPGSSICPTPKSQNPLAPESLVIASSCRLSPGEGLIHPPTGHAKQHDNRHNR